MPHQPEEETERQRQRFAGGQAGSGDDFVSRLLAAGAGFGLDDAPTPIGVPDDFRAQRTISPPRTTRDLSPRAAERAGAAAARAGRPGEFVHEIAPSFFNGDQFKPSGMSPTKVAALQAQLVDAGLLEAPYNKGHWDGPSISAYEQLLGWANTRGISSPGQALEEWLRTSDEFGTAKPEPPPLQIDLDNPEELKRVFKSAVIEKLGVGWDEKRLDQMVSSYHDIQRRVQKEAFEKAQGAEPGSEFTIVSPPSAQGFAEDFAEQQDPTGAQVNRGLEFLQLLENTL